jgi:hypothetical protein
MGFRRFPQQPEVIPSRGRDLSNTNIKDPGAAAGSAKVSITNPTEKEAEVENAYRRYKLKIVIRSDNKPGEVLIKP